MKKQFLKIFLFIVLICAVTGLCRCLPEKKEEEQPKSSPESLFKIVHVKKRVKNGLYVDYYDWLNRNLVFNVTIKNTSQYVLYVEYTLLRDHFIKLPTADPGAIITPCDGGVFRHLDNWGTWPTSWGIITITPGAEYSFLLNLDFNEEKICHDAEFIGAEFALAVTSDEDISHYFKIDNPPQFRAASPAYIQYLTFNYWLDYDIFFEVEPYIYAPPSISVTKNK